MNNQITNGKFKVDFSQFKKRMDRQAKSLPLNIKKSLSVAGAKAKNEIKKEQGRIGATGGRNPYIGKKDNRYALLQQLTRFRYASRVAGTRVPHVKIGIFPGKAGRGKALKNNAFAYMGFKTLRALQMAMVKGKKLRITPQNRKRMVREAARAGSRLHFVKKSTKFIQFKPIDFLPFMGRSGKRWVGYVKKETRKRMVKSFAKGK